MSVGDKDRSLGHLGSQVTISRKADRVRSPPTQFEGRAPLEGLTRGMFIQTLCRALLVHRRASVAKRSGCQPKCPPTSNVHIH